MFWSHVGCDLGCLAISSQASVLKLKLDPFANTSNVTNAWTISQLNANIAMLHWVITYQGLAQLPPSKLQEFSWSKDLDDLHDIPPTRNECGWASDILSIFEYVVAIGLPQPLGCEEQLLHNFDACSLTGRADTRPSTCIMTCAHLHWTILSWPKRWHSRTP